MRTTYAIPSTPLLLRLVDYMMRPIMYLLGGGSSDAVQETHPWHVWRGFDPSEIDLTLAVKHKGTDTTKYTKRLLFLFHAPLFGGWKKYVVLKLTKNTAAYNVGWVVKEGELIKEYGIQMLTLAAEPVRMLSGPKTCTTYFFAISADGVQQELTIIDQGTLGDHRHKKVRLL